MTHGNAVPWCLVGSSRVWKGNPVMTVQRNSWWVVVLLLMATACGNASTNAEPGQGASPPEASEAAVQGAESVAEGPQHIDSFDPGLKLDQEWVGDLDAMVERGVVRALVVYTLGQYFLDGATQRGATYEALTQFETFLNEKVGRKKIKVSVLIIPVQRDELLPALERGLGDIAAANLTITDSRLETVDFSNPFLTEVSELVVSGPSAQDMKSLDDLSGREIHVRRSSSYWRSLEKLNDDLHSRDLKPIEMVRVEEFLQDEDLIEMVNAGMLPAIIVDSHKARFWAQFFDHITVHEDLAVRTGGSIGWAFRKDSPQLAEVVNAFVRKHKKGTLLGNVILNRYLKDTKWARNAISGEDRVRFERRSASSEVRRTVRLRPPDARRPRLPGVGTRPVGEQRCRRGRHHAGVAVDRSRPQRRHPGHHDDGKQHSRRHQVPAFPA